MRVGITLGDVIVEGDDIHGDGVNIAARLQELAEPGGIMISGPVYDQVHDKLSISFDRLGEQQVKNVAKPIVSYRVVQGNAAARDARPPSEENTKRKASQQSTGQPRTILSSIWQWYMALPRPIAVLVALIGFLFLLNIFSGLDDIWFHWPAAPLLLIVVLWSILTRKPS
jgi:adenylate cyclase